MTKTLFFYDLETSGFSPSEQRIMQFAGQRVDLELIPIGKPFGTYIKLTDDIIPDPQAIMVTGITPQKTIQEGISEVDFLKVFNSEISTPNTVFVGFNTVRFDDEFMRYLHYRNFYDPYEWQWQDGRGKWDLLDVARMTRALRPEGINWPIENGKNVNRLESLTKANSIKHTGAHDALADVEALLELARLLKTKQPKLFEFLQNIMSNKKLIAELVNAPNLFVYTSGKYPSEYEKTTVVAKLIDHPERAAALVFDLRYDPRDYEKLTIEELAEAWLRGRHDELPRLPVKTLQFNRCPAIAPLGVLDESSQDRINLSLNEINQNYIRLKAVQTSFGQKMIEVINKLDTDQLSHYKTNKNEVDAMLYNDFFSDSDKRLARQVRNSSIDELRNIDVKFSDDRLKLLLPLYKARNFHHILSNEEVEVWEKFRLRRLLGGNEASRMSHFFSELQYISEQTGLNSDQRYLLEELKLYAESIMPVEA